MAVSNLEGTSFDPRDGKIEDWPAGRMDANLQMIAQIAAICSDASVEQSDNQFVSRGMPTEVAFKILVEKMGFPEGLDKASSLAYVVIACGVNYSIGLPLLSLTLTVNQGELW